eukprot:CAMPEP_0117023046 /NCGR_PEP_ID=MMETSP0472-20121206/17244_1 /TAXON_ID=693140 ORGANISM="Tiarina fusus, Strain LIS" /NCGR_SAMPLE_ID=MMETSP0472 /ASSEMBLY_ACC=CAM_ASM_000603 /LENGTH=724 /DNA_ID=CAMNT_0004729059 /DNA_START=90 /DNA_END=2264 /DNA_ORIENTATION=+
MKLIISLSLLAVLPAATGNLLRGTGADIEATVFGAQRHLQEQCVDSSYYGGDGDLAICCMPDQIDHDFFTHDDQELWATISHTGSSTGLESSYWHIAFDGSPGGGRLSNVKMSGWCVDLSRYSSSNRYQFDVFSTYDDFPYDNVLDSPEQLDNVNWMINNFRLGETYTVPAGFNYPERCSLTQDLDVYLNWQTMQNAVWRVVDRGLISGNYLENAGNDCLTYYMVQQAEQFGDNYEPSCDDPLAEMAVILIVDLGDNVIDKQVIIGEAKLAEIPGACKPAECCEQLSIDHETFQENNEITVSVTPDGSSDSSYLVDFTGTSVYGTLSDLDAWSVDLDRADLPAGANTLLVDTYSTYDNWYRFNVVQNKDNIPKVNYLINNHAVGSSCSGSAVTADDFQQAVHALVDDDAVTTSTVAFCLLTQAHTNGAGYEPSCAAGTTDKLAVLLLVDAEGDLKDKINGGLHENDVVRLENVAGHVIIVEVPIAQISGACYMKECECCEIEFEFPVASPVDTRDDPTGSAPVEELSTPAPVPAPRPVCLDPIEIKGSGFADWCAHKGVTVIGSDPAAGGPSPALRIDILDTIFGIYTGSDDTSVSFRVQNPFAGGSVDMYVQYEKGVEGEDRARFVNCDSDPSVDECQAFGGDNGNVFTAECVDPRINDPSKQPYALVTTFFVETGSDLFTFETTNDVPECCEPDTANTGTVVSYTFEIMCTCPGGNDAQYRE